MHCSTSHFKNRILYRCLSILLLIGLMLRSTTPLQSHEVWDESLLFRKKSKHWLHRRSCDDRVRLAFLTRRGKALLCRLSLVAVLLMRSGWSQRQPLTWTLLGLPLADFLLSLLPLRWPRVLKVKAYPHVVRGVRDLYHIVVVTLLCEALLPHKDEHYPWIVGGCVQTADGGKAQGGIKEDGTWWLEMEGHVILTYKPRNFFEERILLFVFRQFRTPESTAKRPFLRQEWLAKWFVTKQELISRWLKYVREGGLEKLNGEYDGWVATPEIRQAILDIWIANFWLSAVEVRERLLAARHISSLEDISESSIHRVAEEK